MHSIDTTDMPIYAAMIEEHGDVPADVRDTAERTLRRIEQVMDFRTQRPSAA
ncbi:hypothetical protein [Streptomyces sp. NBC_01304]|uniref:hypothetical protein n=1 Tax=Streptomyces sp. NBC_01304 TaxID=2903818 RepID=UPI002E12BAB2|nr:hypothetical protein OG430_05055 [Streptomyces sp. NBC_01304]